MLTLHVTKKLLIKLPLDAEDRLPVTAPMRWLHNRPGLENNPLSGWHGNLVVWQRRQCVLLVHDATRFALLLPALNKADFLAFNERMLDAFINSLLKLGASEQQLDAVHRCWRALQVDSETSRSELTTLNRIKIEIEHLLYHDKVNLAEVTGYRLSAWLNETPRSTKSRSHFFPNQEMLDLLQQLADNKNQNSDNQTE